MVVGTNGATVRAEPRGEPLSLRLEPVDHEQAMIPRVDDHVFLLGRPTLPEFVGFVQDLSPDGPAADVRPLAEAWRRAQRDLARRERDEAGAADGALPLPLPPELEPMREACLEAPVFRGVFDLVPVDIAMVELDRLVVWQKHVNLEHVHRIRERLGSAPSPREVFETCLPMHGQNPAVQWMRLPDDSFVFTSSSADLRFLGAWPLRPGELPVDPPPGQRPHAVALAVGFGPNVMNAVLSGGRLVLHDGTHRAFALRELGVTHVPCAVLRADTPEEMRAVAAPDVRRNGDYYYGHPRPPLLRDYFDPALRTIVPCIRRARHVRISFQVTTHDLPAY